MSFFSFFLGQDINGRLREMRDVKGAVLLDIRNPEEYREGHIPGAINIPLDNIESVQKKIKKVDTPIYTYCLSGARSSKAVRALKIMGYRNVTNIGGISRYRGKLER